MSKLSRTKGHSFERKIASECREIGFPEARRQLEYHEDDAKGVDIQGTGCFKIQCKKLKAYVSINTIKEVQCDREKEIPILVTAGDGLEPMAVISWSDLKLLIKNYNEAI